MHDCEYYQELMSRLLDEGVTEAEEKELREHMRACPECARLFSALSAVTGSVTCDQCYRFSLALEPRGDLLCALRDITRAAVAALASVAAIG